MILFFAAKRSISFIETKLYCKGNHSLDSPGELLKKLSRLFAMKFAFLYIHIRFFELTKERTEKRTHGYRALPFKI